MSIVCVTSGKGGTGTSCVTAYLGAALACMNRRILLLELGPKSLDIITGTMEDGVFDLGDILEGRCEPQQAVVESTFQPGLFLLPGATHFRPASYEQIKAVVDQLAGQFDDTFIDCGISWATFPQLLEKADQVLAVTSPELMGARAVGRMTQLLSQAAFENARLIINKVPVNFVPANNIHDLDDVIDMAGLRLMGVLPYSRDIRQSSLGGRPLNQQSMAGQIFGAMAGRLMGEQVSLIIG
ncbi:cellulose synthase operon protein YhjQ/BcsQ [Oscillospiraceae bacterium MB08-C2-2]|nr:cellulose synthase operon protein YhjQ/BcsQ [Oscillospiraceae bacterium MB08-C2-2]